MNTRGKRENWNWKLINSEFSIYWVKYTELTEDLSFSQGLFGMPELTRPEGFLEAQEKSLAEVKDLLNEVIHTQPCQEVVVLFDKLSDALCRVADLVSTHIWKLSSKLF